MLEVITFDKGRRAWLQGHVAAARRMTTPLVVVVLLLVACVLPLILVANWTELNTAPDEAAHYVTSLMIRDYLSTAFGSDPRAFAEQYYLHYPKVAFGIWPPLFHVTLGVWMLLAGASLGAALTFMGLTTTLVAFLVYRIGREALGVPLALASAVWFATMPDVQATTTSVMMDMLCALLMLGAAFAFGRYMTSERTWHALAFAGLAAAAVLTKYNALALALLPPLAIVTARRWSLMARRNFWLMPAVVAVVCAPWYASHWQMVKYASEPAPPPGAWMTVGHANFSLLLSQAGLLAVPLIFLGTYQFVVRRRQEHQLWCSMFALLVAVFGFHSVLYPIHGARYLLPATAVMTLLAAAGVHSLVTGLPWSRASMPWHWLRIAAALLLVLALAAWSPRHRPARGFSEAAEFVLRSAMPANGTSLVSSDPIGEGAFVAHVASHERPRHSLVLRGSKLLAKGTWMGLHYSPRYTESGALLGALDRARVEYVVLDDQNDEPHHRMIALAMTQSADWMLVRRARAESTLNPSEVLVYGRTHPLPPGPRQFDLDTKRSLGYDVSVR